MISSEIGSTSSLTSSLTISDGTFEVLVDDAGAVVVDGTVGVVVDVAFTVGADGTVGLAADGAAGFDIDGASEFDVDGAAGFDIDGTVGVAVDGAVKVAVGGAFGFALDGSAEVGVNSFCRGKVTNLEGSVVALGCGSIDDRPIELASTKLLFMTRQSSNDLQCPRLRERTGR